MGKLRSPFSHSTTMPLGIGKYSQHYKVSTNGNDDDGFTCSTKNSIILFLGEKSLPVFLVKDVTAHIDKVYSQNYSPLGALAYLRKFKLVINCDGITVSQPATRKFPAKVIMKYHLPDLLFVTTDLKHEKVFALVLRKPEHAAVIHVYFCNNADQAKTLVDECIDAFQNSPTLQNIKVRYLPDGVEFVYKRDMLHVVSSDVSFPTINVEPKFSSNVCEEDLEMTNKHENEGTDEHESKGINELMEFGDFQVNIGNSVQEGSTTIQCNDDIFVDEFEQLALKRNIYQPDHLQDRTVESVLLVQNHARNSQSAIQQQPLFSSYNEHW